jgi:hypothetical protein
VDQVVLVVTVVRGETRQQLILVQHVAVAVVQV